MKRFGLIGFPLSHSFSKKYFTEFFEKEGLAITHSYDLFELEDGHSFPELFQSYPDLVGLNVTIPHKKVVMQHLQDLDHSAKRVGAVNVIKFTSKGLIGYNSDYYGFKKSLLEFLGTRTVSNAMILGYGGAALAVQAVLEDLGIFVSIVSRREEDNFISYEEANTLLPLHHLVINCTPLGTYPNVDAAPNLDYTVLTDKHLLFDLVYNPAVSLFLKNGKKQGAGIQNGYNMLVYQAEKSWEIWNS